jgi:O-antigen ligase
MNSSVLHSQSTGSVRGTVAALLVVSVLAADLVLHPGSMLLVLVIAASAALVIEHPDLALGAVVFLTPIESFGPLNFVTTKSIKLALTALAGCALYWRYRTRAPFNKPGDLYRWPFFLMIFSASCSTLLAKSPWTSMAGLASLFVFLLFYSAVRRSGIGLEKRQTLLTIVMWSGIVASMFCIAQFLLGYSGFLGSPEQRAMEAEGVMDTFWPGIERGSAAFNGPSAAGAFLAIAALIALTHAQIFRQSRIKFLGAACLCVLGLLATFSRGALLGLLAGCGFAFWTMGFLPRRRVWLIGSLAVFVLPALFAAEGARNYLRLGSDLVSVSESRVDAWQATRVILRRHPLFGIGFYEFRGVAQGIEGFSDTPLHPHNGFLKALVEQGPLGGCGYLLYVAAFLRTAYNTGRNTTGKPLRWVHGAIAGAGVSLFTQELFDANLTMGGSSLAILFAAFLGLQVSLHSKVEAEAHALAFTPRIATAELQN